MTTTDDPATLYTITDDRISPSPDILTADEFRAYVRDLNEEIAAVNNAYPGDRPDDPDDEPWDEPWDIDSIDVAEHSECTLRGGAGIWMRVDGEMTRVATLLSTDHQH